MTAETVTGIGSVTKVFVAIVVLQLMEAGKLTLDDRVGDYLEEEIAGIANADSASISQLMNHTACIPSWEDDTQWIQRARGALLDKGHSWTKTEPLDYVRGTPAACAPGAQYRYSNTHYTLLGLIIEKVTSNTAESEVRRRILEPLGLSSAFFDGFEPPSTHTRSKKYHLCTPDFESRAGVSHAHVRCGKRLVDIDDANLSCEWTAGGMVANAHDLARFGGALCEGRLLGQRATALLTRWRDTERGYSVGYNLFRTPVGDGRHLIGHSGDVLGSSATLYWTEPGNIVVALLANAGSMHSGSPSPAVEIGRSWNFIRLAEDLAKDGGARATG